MRKIPYKILSLSFLLMLVFTACNLDEITDPNAPDQTTVTEDPGKAELQSLVYGLVSRHRLYYENATEMFGSFGREVWAFFGSDPRFKDDWLGADITETYPDFFASGGTYVDPYLAVKQANFIIAGANSSTSLTAEEAAGYSGFAKTIKGYQLLWPLLQQGTNGIRVDVEEPLNPGPILDFDAALAAIRAIIDEGAEELGRGTIDFNLTGNFAGFSDAESMLRFNRAVAAKAAMYAEDWPAMQTALEASYLDLGANDAGDLNAGPVHTFGNSPDLPNPLFYPLGAATATILMVHPAMVEDALPGDGRLDKFFLRSDTLFTTAVDVTLQASYQDNRFNGITDAIPYLRNEELILMYAEARAQQPGGASDAVDAINTVRNIWSVGDYTGPTDTDSLIDEILFQRRYSLWAEAGQRWLDLRRYDRLNADNVDLRDGGVLFQQVARRVSEIAWEGN